MPALSILLSFGWSPWWSGVLGDQVLKFAAISHFFDSLLQGTTVLRLVPTCVVVSAEGLASSVVVLKRLLGFLLGIHVGVMNPRTAYSPYMAGHLSPPLCLPFFTFRPPSRSCFSAPLLDCSSNHSIFDLLALLGLVKCPLH